jgi:predicted nucleic acid-binding protein
VTILDTSVVVDYLLGSGVAEEAQALMSTEGELAAPDLLVFEVLAVLRRQARRGEPLATKDAALSAEAERHSSLRVLQLGPSI